MTLLINNGTEESSFNLSIQTREILMQEKMYCFVFTFPCPQQQQQNSVVFDD
jgi:hypothetical protein